MTWGAWLVSNYNTDSFYKPGEHLIHTADTLLVVDSAQGTGYDGGVSDFDTIIPNYAYTTWRDGPTTKPTTPPITPN